MSDAAPEFHAKGDADNCADATQPERQRRIRSFVLRQGRFTPAQQRAFETQWARYGLDYSGSLRDFDKVFGRHAPRVLEIGFGNGEALLHAAHVQPERDLIGIEVHRPGVGRALHTLAAHAVENVRVYCHDAVDVLQHEIAPESLHEVRIYFPDPWHKKRHHKRRLVQPELVQLLASRLRVGALLHLATDWEDYARQMWEVLDAQPQFRNRAGPGGAMERPMWRPQTHFERRGRRLGHGVWDLFYDRC